MNRFEFGSLVASLREDMRWTQMELAEKSGVDVSAISNIERGARKTLLKDNMLVKLADGFQLTSMERQEFLFAASGVTELEAVRKENSREKKQFDPQAFLKEIGEHIACITLPVLVTDAFCDILIANHCLIDFYGTPSALLTNADHIVGGYNLMRYIFDPLSNFPEIIGEDRFERLAWINVHYFRRRTLRVRSKPYFSSLMNELLNNKKYPSFERYWRRMMFEDYDDFTTPIKRSGPEYDHSFVAVESLLALTPYGELYLHQILPLNKKTAKRIEGITNKVGEGYALFAPFPDKNKK
ncbi:MAG: helix-turn-helix domain-containing protein [Anaerolineales bacterium]|uniref:helix-turn-helix domain-containing protein n=1 Tax=Candidatus Villigracilis proximus TaxID=3140683 RepID=UPI003134CB66|nr:helix-turn-helix domain-containing protein [Anaerolineales bacterium]